jgi:hypothetical protein
VEFFDRTGSFLARYDPATGLLEDLGERHFISERRELPLEARKKTLQHPLDSGAERLPAFVEQPELSQVLHGSPRTRYWAGCALFERAVNASLRAACGRSTAL